MITTDMSYVELENNLFSKVSGSKINMDKTEVLINGMDITRWSLGSQMFSL